MAHLPKLAISKKSTIFFLSSWNLVTIFYPLGYHFNQVSWGWGKNWEFFSKSQFWYVCLFLWPRLYVDKVNCEYDLFPITMKFLGNPNELVGSNMAAQGTMLTRFWANTQNVNWTCRVQTLRIELELKMRSNSTACTLHTVRFLEFFFFQISVPRLFHYIGSMISIRVAPSFSPKAF